jgi:hypothetical protein
MDWLAFAAAFAVVLSVLLAWHGFAAWMLRRAPRLRLPVAGGLFLVLAVPAAWFVGNQPISVLWGTMTACAISAVIGQLRLIRRRNGAARP